MQYNDTLDMKDSYEIDSVIPQNITWWRKFYKVLTTQLELLAKITLSIENAYFIGRFASLHTPVYGYNVTTSYNKVGGSTSLADW